MKLVSNYLLAVIIFAGLSLLLWYVLPYEGHWELDSGVYERWAAFFGGYHSMEPGESSIVTLGYPAILALVYWLLGKKVGVVVVVQLMGVLVTYWLIIRCAVRLFSARAGIMAAYLGAVHLGFLLYAQLVMTEIFCVLFLTLFLERIIMTLTTHRWVYAAQAGLALGCSVTIKPAGLLFIIPVLLLLVWVYRAAVVRYAGAFLIFFYGPIVMAMAVNYYLFGIFAAQSHTAFNLYCYFLPKLVAAVADVPLGQVNKLVSLKINGSALDAAAWHEQHQLLVTYVSAHPFIALKVWLLNVTKTLLGLFSTQLKTMLNPALMGGKVAFFYGNGSLMANMMAYMTAGTVSPWVTLITLFEAMLTPFKYIFTAVGLYCLVSIRHYGILFLLVSYLSYFALVTGHDGSGRYRMMIEPALMLLMAGAVAMVYERFQMRKKHAMIS